MLTSMAAVAELTAALVDLYDAVSPGSPSEPGSGTAHAGLTAAALPSLEAFEKSTQRVERVTTTLLEALEADVAAGRKPLSELEQLIDDLARRERDLAEILVPGVENLETRDVFRLPRDVRSRTLKVIQRQKRVVYSALEFLRDTRWRLMALRAKVEEPGSGPTFDDADALERYLEQL